MSRQRLALMIAGLVLLIAGSLYLMRGPTPKAGAAKASTVDAAAPTEEEGPGAKVAVGLAAEENLAPLVQLPGTVISRNDSRIATEVVGTIVWIAEVGAQVEAGGVIARLDDTMLKLAVAENAATVAELEASHKFQRLEAERLAQLLKSQHVSQTRYDQVTAERDMRASELAQARARLAQARHQLSKTEIRVPFSGRVVERHGQLGEYVSVGDPIARVVDTVNLEIRVQAPVSSAPFLAVGDEVQLTDDARAALSPISAIVPVGDAVSRTFELRIAVPAGSWVIGTAVRVDVPNGALRKVVTVPRDALVIRSDSIFVYRVTAENRAERIEVTPGTGRGDRVEVRGSLAAGERVIVRGAEMISAGAKVDINGSS